MASKESRTGQFSLRRSGPILVPALLLGAVSIYSWEAALPAAVTQLADAAGAVLVKAPSLKSLEFQAQDEGEGDEESIPGTQVDKYIAVYKAMQRNHSLTVEQATAAQGLSVEAFRDIEAKVERDDLIRERVRQALRGDSTATPAASPAAGR